VDDPGVARALGELREQRWADEASLSAESARRAVHAGAGPGLVHEKAQLVNDIKLGVRGFPEAHQVALAFLVLFAQFGVQRGTAHDWIKPRMKSASIARQHAAALLPRPRRAACNPL
jgi:hypothetical protein